MTDEPQVDAYIVGALVADLHDPVPGSQQRWCGICAELIWLSPEGLAFHDGTTYTPVCIDCFDGLRRTDPDVRIEPVPGNPRMTGPLWNAIKRRMGG